MMHRRHSAKVQQLSCECMRGDVWLAVSLFASVKDSAYVFRAVLSSPPISSHHAHTHYTQRASYSQSFEMRPKYTPPLSPCHPHLRLSLPAIKDIHIHKHTQSVPTTILKCVVCHPKAIRSYRPSCLSRVFGNTNRIVPLESPWSIPFIQPESSLLCYAWSSSTRSIADLSYFDVSDLDIFRRSCTSSLSRGSLSLLLHHGHLVSYTEQTLI